MTKRLIASVITFLSISTLICSCSSKDIEQEPTDPSTQAEQQDVIGFQLILNTSDAFSRTTEEEVDGTGYENYIDPESIHILLYGTSYYQNNYIYGPATLSNGQITPKYVIKYNSGQYLVKGDIFETSIPDDGNFKLVVTANWPNTPNYTIGMCLLTNVAPNDYTYEYGYDSSGNPTYYEPSADNPIPMYGVIDVSESQLMADGTYSVGKVNMYRAMAKIIINIDDSHKDNIEYVKLNYCMNRGMCAPMGMYSDEGQPQDKNVNIPRDQSYGYSMAAGGTYNYPSVYGPISDLPFKGDGNGQYTVYVPEFRSTGTKNEVVNVKSNFAGSYVDADKSWVYLKSKIIIKTKDREEPFVFDFKDYDEDGNATSDYLNIIRNHAYVYNVIFANRLAYLVTNWDNYTAGDVTFE